MARKKYRFRPDPVGADIWNKLYITPRDRAAALKWGLYGLVCVAALIVQDALLSRVRLFGAFVDLAPCAIMLVCVMQGVEAGSVFALAASMVFVFSGSAPDTFAIAFVTVNAVLVTLFRENFLRRSFSSAWLCTSVALMGYELCVWLLGLFFGLTYPGRVGVFALSGAVTSLTVPALYPLMGLIGKIGGETWKE
jgi:hypothetical protein